MIVSAVLKQFQKSGFYIAGFSDLLSRNGNVVDQNTGDTCTIGTDNILENLIADDYGLIRLQIQHLRGLPAGSGIRLARFGNVWRIDIFQKIQNTLFAVIREDQRLKAELMQSGKQPVHFGCGWTAMMNERIVEIKNQPANALSVELFIIDRKTEGTYSYG